MHTGRLKNSMQQNNPHPCRISQYRIMLSLFQKCTTLINRVIHWNSIAFWSETVPNVGDIENMFVSGRICNVQRCVKNISVIRIVLNVQFVVNSQTHSLWFSNEKRMNTDEFVRKEERSRRQNARRWKREEKADVLVISLVRGRLVWVLTRDRKKDVAIYKARYHRNWASLRQTEGEHGTWEVDDLKRGFSTDKNDLF